MAGQLGRRNVQRLQRVEGAPVVDAPARRAGLGVGDLAHLVVPEAIAAGRLAQQAAAEQLVEGRQGVVFANAGHPAQRLEREAVAQHGAGGERGARRRAEMGEPGEDHLPHAGRDEAVWQG